MRIDRPLDKSVSSKNEPRHEISNNIVCETSKGSDQPEHMRSLIRALLVTRIFYEC